MVFHTAAYKHVPLLERDPIAAIVNNVFATETVAALAAKHGARLLFLSTDKAVQPTSVMGATKRVAEEIVAGYGGTVLRLANVLASSGSVTEIFAQQIAHGGPLTVTDPSARRYFLTMDEAANLMLTAAAITSPAVLAPALSADHGIVELANFIARQLAPGRDVPIRFTGMRPGDKLTERLWDESEHAFATCGSLLSISSSRPEPATFAASLFALRTAVAARDLAAALTHLRTLVPGFRPSQTVLALAQKCTSQVCA
jgi:O-antigen biosynthesis protein WbqV